MIIFIIISLFCANTFAFPGQLKTQKFEFQEFYSRSSQNNVSSSSQNVTSQDVQNLYETTPWSQQHPNEVNAFAEMFRQNYNQMIAQHNELMQMHQQTAHNMFIPVTYELYRVPVGYTWNSYFGNQKSFVQDETERMSRQLIEDLELGRRTQEEIMNPNFFVEQAANELNRVYQSHQLIEADDENSYQQNHQSILSEPFHQTEFEHTNYAVVYDDAAKQYEYVEVQNSPRIPPHEELAGSMNVQHTSYVQNLPPVKFDNGKLYKFNDEIEQIEIHTPISIETPRYFQPSSNEFDFKSTSKPEANDEYYGSTYDQQPKFDLKFEESQMTPMTLPKSNVMSLVRNRSKLKVSTTTEEALTTTTTTTTTTTPVPTTTSGIMSMLPHKKPSMNYTELYHTIRSELDKQLKQMDNNKTEETHFMGMTSNSDHIKLTYETMNQENNTKESRGDQGRPTDDYNYEVLDEVEPGLGAYSVKTEPTFTELPSSSYKPTISLYPTYPNPIYSASLAPYPTKSTTSRPFNPYYSAPLAPYPDKAFRETSNAQHVQISHDTEYSEAFDMNQEIQSPDYHYGEQSVTVEGSNNFEEFNHDEFQMSHGYVEMQQFEDVQKQRYTDINSGVDVHQTLQRPQIPPEQAYHNPNWQQFSNQYNEIPAHVQEIVVTPVATITPSQKKSWLQRQFDKFKNVL